MMCYQDALLSKVHDKHLHERLSLVQMLRSCDQVKAEQLQLIDHMSEVQRQTRLCELQEKRASLPLGGLKRASLSLGFTFVEHHRHILLLYPRCN